MAELADESDTTESDDDETNKKNVYDSIGS